jgi:hypothetical protein
MTVMSNIIEKDGILYRERVYLLDKGKPAQKYLERIGPVGGPQKNSHEKIEDMTVKKEESVTVEEPENTEVKPKKKKVDSHKWDGRHRICVPHDLYILYKEKAIELHGERGLLKLLEELTRFFPQL